MGICNLCFNFVQILTYGFYILVALIALLIMITIHEFGHFVAGKMLGFKINEFSVGFGKPLFKKKTKDGIDVSLRMVPLGGYCAFEGEDSESNAKGAFNNQAPWKRLIVLFFGAFFNFLSAVIFFFILLVSFGFSDCVQVKSIDPTYNSYNNVAQFQKNDIIVSVNGVKTNFLYDNYYDTLVDKVDLGSNYKVEVKRDGEIVELNFVNGILFTKNTNEYVFDKYSFAVEDNTDDIIIKSTSDNKEIAKFDKDDKVKKYAYNYDDRMFIYTSDGDLYFKTLGIQYNRYVYTAGEALVKCVPFTIEWAWKILLMLWQLITGQIGLDNVGGPLTTISVMAEYTQTNWINLLILFPLISVNLAAFNLLPFPALDGARMVFVAIEWIRGKPVNRNVEGYIHTVGLLILFAFVIIVDAMNFLGG